MLAVLKFVFRQVDFDSALKEKGKKSGDMRVLSSSRVGGCGGMCGVEGYSTFR